MLPSPDSNYCQATASRQQMLPNITVTICLVISFHMKSVHCYFTFCFQAARRQEQAKQNTRP